MSEIRKIVEEWTEETREALIKALKRRRFVAQFTLVSDIEVQIVRADEQDISVNFIFHQKHAVGAKIKGVFKLKDPIFNKFKPYTSDAGEKFAISKRSIYKRLEDKYFIDLAVRLSKHNVELASNIVIKTLQ